LQLIHYILYFSPHIFKHRYARAGAAGRTEAREIASNDKNREHTF
jgi:hypothetical protein